MWRCLTGGGWVKKNSLTCLCSGGGGGSLLGTVVRLEAACVGRGERLCLLGFGSLVCVRGRLLPLGVVATCLVPLVRSEAACVGIGEHLCLLVGIGERLCLLGIGSLICVRGRPLAMKTSYSLGWLCVVAGDHRMCLSSQVSGCGSLAQGPTLSVCKEVLLTRSVACVQVGLAQMLKGGVIMDVVNADEARIAEEAGAVAVMALERVPADIRKDGGVARMSDPSMIREIKAAVTIPVMAKARIGHFVEAQILEALGVDYVDESEVCLPALSARPWSVGAVVRGLGQHEGVK